MGIKPLFIDTGGFFALLVQQGAAHTPAVAIMEAARRLHRRAVTTDQIVSETATLLRARGLARLLPAFFQLCDKSAALSLEWTTPHRHAAARRFMLQHLDQDFSFTDCTSFIVMKELHLHDALATDRHFWIAGFHPLLAKT